MNCRNTWFKLWLHVYHVVVSRSLIMIERCCMPQLFLHDPLWGVCSSIILTADVHLLSKVFN